jgi:hypothetical protein
VANAYRHRSLYRFEMLRREIPTRMMGAPAEYKDEANKTILELFRLSGILLLIPGESSYLDKPAGRGGFQGYLADGRSSQRLFAPG